MCVKEFGCQLVMTKESKRSYQAPALDKGLDIIEFLSLQATSQSLTEIAQALGRSHNEIYRMLARLEERRYVLRDEQSSKYYLSLKLFHLSHTHSPLEFLRNAAIGPMRRLAESVRQACHLAILFEDTMMVVLRVRSPLFVTLSVEEGTRSPLVYTVSGRLLLAYVFEEDREAILKRNTEFQAMDRRMQTALRTQLAQICQQGHHVAASDMTEGVTDVGVPIGSVDAQVFAALTLPCINTVSAVNDQKLVLTAALKCAQEINDVVGLAWPPVAVAKMGAIDGKADGKPVMSINGLDIAKRNPSPERRTMLKTVKSV